MLQNIHYLSPSVPHSARLSQREYENVVGRRLKPNMREWKKGRHRGDCISPNGQNSDGPIQCGVLYCGPTIYSVECRLRLLLRSALRPPWEEEASRLF